MSEYIRKKEATSIPVILKEHRKHFNNLDDAFETGWNEALACVNMIPSADVVEVVRCKDCIHYDEHTRWQCDRFGQSVNTDDYCSCGERKDQEHDASNKSNL